MEAQMDLLIQKVDVLSQQVATLSHDLERQAWRQKQTAELKDELAPIANQLFRRVIEELDDVGNENLLEELKGLGKRLLREVDTINRTLDSLFGLMALWDEGKRISPEVYHTSIQILDRLDRAGYFDFARGLTYVADRVVTEFSEEDVRALGDNIVTILTTVRQMTQPEVLALASNAVGAIQDEADEVPASSWQLLRELSDPQVRKGLARLLRLVKSLANHTSMEALN